MTFSFTNDGLIVTTQARARPSGVGARPAAIVGVCTRVVRMTVRRCGDAGGGAGSLVSS